LLDEAKKSALELPTFSFVVPIRLSVTVP